MKNLILLFATVITLTTQSQAQEFDMVRIQQVIQDNRALDTEKKAANILIAYAEMMGYLSKDLVSGMASSVNEVLPQVVALLKEAKGNNDPE